MKPKIFKWGGRWFFRARCCGFGSFPCGSFEHSIERLQTHIRREHS